MLLCVATMPLTACSQPMNTQTKPEYRENPAPRQAYRLTMRIDDAPGPLKIMVSAAQYDVVNKECLPPPKENPGGRSSPVPTNDIPFELTHVAENEYTGVVYVDGMLDEDYHGRGVCRWALIQAQVQLKATGADGETKFIASLSRSQNEIASSAPKITYYWKRGYPSAGVRDFPDFGEPDEERFKLDIRGELFSITLHAEEGTP